MVTSDEIESGRKFPPGRLIQIIHLFIPATSRKGLRKSSEAIQKANNLNFCPDIWQLDTGDFAVIGTDLTAAAVATWPPGLFYCHRLKKC